MASEKQIAANRANAQKSTGPKTAAGRSKAGRNAFRHGLSLPVEIDGDVSAKIEALVEALVSNNLDTDRSARHRGDSASAPGVTTDSKGAHSNVGRYQVGGKT